MACLDTLTLQNIIQSFPAMAHFQNTDLTSILAIRYRDGCVLPHCLEEVCLHLVCMYFDTRGSSKPTQPAETEKGALKCARLRGHCRVSTTHQVLITESSELLELLGYEELGTAHCTADRSHHYTQKTTASQPSQQHAGSLNGHRAQYFLMAK